MKCSLAFCFGYDSLCSFAAHGVTEYASKQQKEVTTVEQKIKTYTDFIQN